MTDFDVEPVYREAYQTRQEWLDERTRSLGGTDVSAVLGHNPYSTPLQVYYEKMGLDLEPRDERANQRMYYGQILEPVVAAEVAKDLRYDVENPGWCRFTNPRWPHLHHSPDRFLWPRGATLPGGAMGERAKGLLEIKTGGLHMQRDWRDGAIPRNYWVQCQVGLHVMGLRWGVVAAFLGAQLMLYRDIQIDPSFTEQLDEANEWYRRHVVAGEPPDPTPEDLPNVGRVHAARADGTAVGFTAEDEEAQRLNLLRDIWYELDHQRRDIEARQKAIKTEVALVLGDADEAWIDGERAAAWITSPPVEVKAHKRAGWSQLRLFERK